MAQKPKKAPHLRVRLEPVLLARLEKSRAKIGRTLTGEIAHRLEQSFQREDQEELIRATVRHMIETADETLLSGLFKYLPPEQQAKEARASLERRGLLNRSEK